MAFADAKGGLLRSKKPSF